MPRDKRLWMTFPIDFWTHLKVAPRSDAAFRAFVEMNGHSRMRDLDGRIEAVEAEFMWTKPVLDELVASHPTRPLVVRDGDDYVIRDYSEHQETVQSREDRRQRNAANGAKGGRPPKNPPGTEPKPSGLQAGTQPQPTEKQSLESRVQSPEITSYLLESSPAADTRTDDDETYEALARSVLAGLEIDADKLLRQIHLRTGRTVNVRTAKNIAVDILARAGTVRTTNQQFVLGSVTRSWAEVQQYIDQEELA